MSAIIGVLVMLVSLLIPAVIFLLFERDHIHRRIDIVSEAHRMHKLIRHRSPHET